MAPEVSIVAQQNRHNVTVSAAVSVTGVRGHYLAGLSLGQQIYMCVFCPSPTNSSFYFQLSVPPPRQPWFFILTHSASLRSKAHSIAFMPIELPDHNWDSTSDEEVLCQSPTSTQPRIMKTETGFPPRQQVIDPAAERQTEAANVRARVEAAVNKEGPAQSIPATLVDEIVQHVETGGARISPIVLGIAARAQLLSTESLLAFK